MDALFSMCNVIAFVAIWNWEYVSEVYHELESLVMEWKNQRPNEWKSEKQTINGTFELCNENSSFDLFELNDDCQKCGRCWLPIRK